MITLNVWGHLQTIFPSQQGNRNHHQDQIQMFNSPRNGHNHWKSQTSQRINAIANIISQGNFDVFLLQEIWTRHDHMILGQKIPKGYSMTTFQQLNECDGYSNGIGCSGLAIISKYPFLKVEFHKFHERGCLQTALWDGERIFGKGFGIVRISPDDETNIDVFVTHTAADWTEECSFIECGSCPDYHNYYYRKSQVTQLINLVTKSTADIKIVGGDLNTRPKGMKHQ